MTNSVRQFVIRLFETASFSGLKYSPKDGTTHVGFLAMFITFVSDYLYVYLFY